MPAHAALPTSEVGAPARRRLAPAERRLLLLQAAESTFAVLGYQGTAMEDIASAAGVTRPLVYSYFPGADGLASKDQLYLACLERARHELVERFTEAALAHEEPRDRLQAGITAYFEFVRDSGHRWDLLFGGGTAVAGAVAKHARALRFATVEHISTLFELTLPALPQERALPFAHLLSGAIEQLAQWWRDQPDVPLDEVVDRALDVLWTGLSAHS